MEVRLLDLNDKPQTEDYDSFVAQHSHAGNNMTSNYMRPLIEAFDHQLHTLIAYQGNEIIGVLPFVGTRSPIFGNQLTSLPFYNYGGLLCTDDKAKIPLLQMAKALMITYGYQSIQLRTVEEDPVYEHLQFDTTSEKATFFYELPDIPNKLGAGNSKKRTKLRSQALLAERRCEESGDSLRVMFGGSELLGDFYEVFRTHMRDLGTPVFAQSWFDSVLSHIPSKIVVVYVNDKPLATGWLFTHNDTHWSIPWASCLKAGNALSLNSYMYFRILSSAIENNISSFDFGRSTVDSGPYRFKQQWGPEPTLCHWHTFSVLNTEAAVGPKKEGFGLAVKAWQKLPLGVANVLGPKISKTLG